MKNFSLIKVLVLMVAFAGMALCAHAKTYDVDPGHSTIGFDIRHLVTTVHGRFTKFSGTISYDEANPENSEVRFTVKTTSVNTENSKRDEDLRSGNFFDVENYPDATFVSKKILMIGKNRAKVTGQLTIHGVGKPVTFDVEYLGEATSPWGDKRAGFSAVTTLNRKDFGITWNKALDNGGLLVGDEVKLYIDVEAVLQCRTCGK